MNKILLSITLLMVTHIIPGQISPAKVDDRISAYLGEEIVAKILTERPAHMAYYEYKLNKSYKLMELNEVQEKEISLIEVDHVICTDHDKKSNKYSPQEVIEIIEKGEFNILTSSLIRNKYTPSYYSLLGTGKVILLESERDTHINYKKK